MFSSRNLSKNVTTNLQISQALCFNLTDWKRTIIHNLHIVLSCNINNFNNIVLILHILVLQYYAITTYTGITIYYTNTNTTYTGITIYYTNTTYTGITILH